MSKLIFKLIFGGKKISKTVSKCRLLNFLPSTLSVKIVCASPSENVISEDIRPVNNDKELELSAKPYSLFRDFVITFNSSQ